MKSKLILFCEINCKIVVGTEKREKFLDSKIQWKYQKIPKKKKQKFFWLIEMWAKKKVA